MANELIPISDEQAKAIQEIAKTARDLGSFLGRVFGQPIENAVGLLGGDYLREVRNRNASRMAARTDELLTKRKVLNPEPVSASLAIPLLQAAQDESREQLQELWSRLLANAMDPERASRIRQSFIEVLKRFEPLDALILQAMMERSFAIGPQANGGNISFEGIALLLKTTPGAVEVSLDNLAETKCVDIPLVKVHHISNFGRQLLMALQE
jgi:hypothetical protein